MAPMKGTYYNHDKFTRFCDYGGLVAKDTEKLCTEALVFLLVPLHFGTIQYPVGYVLVDSQLSDPTAVG